MDQEITNSIFSDYLKCEYKAHLNIKGESGTLSDYEEAELGRARDHGCRARERLLRSCSGGVCDGVSLDNVLRNGPEVAVNVALSYSGVRVNFDALLLDPSSPQASYVPVMFVYTEKLNRDHKLSLAFCGLALAKHQSIAPNLGRLIHGSKLATAKVHLDKLSAEAEKTLQQIRQLRATDDPPSLHLNNHCTVCEFQARCRADATEEDDLSLLRGMKGNEIDKLRKKGIFTVTQLSYTFRPRKLSKRSNPRAIKHHNSLQALSIREKWIYVTGRPELKLAPRSTLTWRAFRIRISTISSG